MNINEVLKKINFVDRYKNICSEHNEFNNRMTGGHLKIYESVFNRLNVNYLYIKKHKFFSIKESIGGFHFYLNLNFSNGLVEPLLYIKKNEINLKPNGRLDFIPEEIGLEFDREKFNLPKYKNEDDLLKIVSEILTIYEDVKVEVINSLGKVQSDAIN